MVALQDLEVPEEVFQNVLIGFHLKCMRSFGYITSKQERNKQFHLRKGAIFIASFAIFCCLIFIKISKGFANLAESATSCATAFTYLSTTIATANAFFQRKRVVRMVIFLHEDITELFRITDKEEELMLNGTIKYINITITLMFSSTLIAGFIVSIDTFYRTFFRPETVFNMPAVLNGTAQPILLFQLFPFGEVYDNFIIGYLGPFYAMCLGIVTIPSWHTFVTCLMKYIALKYAIIYKRLKDYDLAKLSVDLNPEALSLLPQRDLQFWHTKMCGFSIREQVKLRWFTKELESLISIPVFSDFIISSVSMCFLFYAIAAGNPSNVDYLFFAMYIFILLFLLWLYHWHGTLVTKSHDELRFALYFSPWYKFSADAQKTILLMMMDSTKPLIMKAIFVELNLRTFIDVVRGAYSYFSLLRHVSLDQ